MDRAPLRIDRGRTLPAMKATFNSTPACSSCPTVSRCSPGPTPSPGKRVVRHSLFKTAHGTRQRWRCKDCGRTFTARSETPYHRLRSSAARFDRVVQLSMEGSSKAAIARIERVSSSTVSRWLERAAGYARRFDENALRESTPEELQADEVRGVGPARKDRHFVFSVIETSARLWLSQRVGPRTRRNCRLLMRNARAKCRLGASRVLIVTDPFRFYRDAVKSTWNVTAVHVESGKIIRGRRIVRVRNKLVHGTEWQLEAARERCRTSKKINTAYIERLNLFIRRSLAYLHRRTTSLARSARKLGEAVDLLQCYYNFVRPHESLRFGHERRTPAMEAGLVTRVLRLRDIFLAFRPMARLPWIVNERVRQEWGRIPAWPPNDS